MQSRDKGFSGEQVVRIETTQTTREKNFDKTRLQLLSLPGVMEVAKTTTVPGDASIDTSTTGMKWNGAEVKMNEVKVSKEYLTLIGAELKEGRWFDGRYADEHTRSVIINEAAAKRMAISSPVGQTIRFPYCDTIPVQIIGVVKDFNIHGLNVPVQPAMFNIGNFACGFRSGGAILVKLDGANTQKILKDIEKLWESIEPEFPLRYSFLNENFQKLYASYQRVQQVVGYFTVVAILIAVMGLFAMSVFFVKEKTKELGIRKVLGAGVIDIFKVTSTRFLWQVTIAMAIAVPFGWIAAQKWLQHFAYRFDLNFSIFLMASVILIIIAFVTVSFQAIKAVIANPVKSLRTE
jgi:putative ABC transport system permease protein